MPLLQVTVWRGTLHSASDVIISIYAYLHKVVRKIVLISESVDQADLVQLVKHRVVINQ